MQGLLNRFRQLGDFTEESAVPYFLCDCPQNISSADVHEMADGDQFATIN